MLGRKHDYEYVKRFFAERGCELLETEYKNANTKMRYRCECGSISLIRLYRFQSGDRCRQCGYRKVAKSNQRLTQETIAAYFNAQGCELLDTYVRSSLPMVYRCVCGNISKTNWNNFRCGKRCQECLRVKRSGPNNYQWISDREAKREYDAFKQRCYKFLKIALKATGQKKNSRTEMMLGYTVKELQAYIKAHPTWKQVSGGRWCVDHIFPIKAFKDYGITDIKVINGLDNLQPLDYKLNISKSGKYDRVKFEAWLQSKGITP